MCSITHCHNLQVEEDNERLSAAIDEKRLRSAYSTAPAGAPLQATGPQAGKLYAFAAC